MSPQTAQKAAQPGWSASAAERPRRPSRRQLRAVPDERPAVRYEPPRLDAEMATTQALVVLAEAGLRGQVSRVLSEPATHLPNHIASVVLLRHGADAQAIHAALNGLPGVRGGHCGEFSVSIYRAVVS